MTCLLAPVPRVQPLPVAVQLEHVSTVTVLAGSKGRRSTQSGWLNTTGAAQ